VRSGSATAKVVSRQIVDEDLDVLANYLGEGLGYPTSYFAGVLARLKSHATPPGYPKYGYVLTEGGKIVGAMVQIFSSVPGPDGPTVRCHMASWLVDPEYRAFAALFFRKALTAPGVTFINTSARPVAIPSIRAQGFKNYSNGQFLSAPLLKVGGDSHKVRVVDASERPDVPFDPTHWQVLLDHLGYGCDAVWCLTPERAYPFIFHNRAFKGVLPGAQLIYSSSIDDFVRFARPLGRYLSRRGIFFVRMDANGPIAGLPGWYFDKMEPRYFKGAAPRLGDLAYTQAVLNKYLRRGGMMST
jgi:hypothetical protein